MARTALLLSLAALLVSACTRDPNVDKREYVFVGDELVAAKKYREAIVEYRNAITLDGRFGEARHKLAKTLLFVDEPEAALREMVRAADLMPDLADVQLEAGRALVAAGRFQDAKMRAENVLRIDPGNVDAYVLLGNATAGLKDFEGAIASMREAIALDPRRSDSYIGLGSAQAAQGQQDEAEASLTRALGVNPKSVPAHLAIADYYWARGRASEAERMMMNALAIEPHNVTVNRALAMLYLTTGRAERAEAPLRTVADASGDPAAMLTLADYFAARHELAKAKATLTPLAQRKEAFPAATARLAGIEYEEGRRAEAHRMVDDVLRQEPANAQILVVKGRWLLAEGKIDEALAEATNAIRANPRLTESYSLLGSVHVARNDPEAAIKAFSRAVALSPGSAPAHLELAQLYLATGRPDDRPKAESLLKTAIENDPSFLQAYDALAQVYIRSGRLDRAQQQYEALIKQTPQSISARTMVGVLLQLQGKATDAREAYEEVLEIDPRAAVAANNLAYMDAERGRDLDIALQRAQTARSVLPDNPEVNDTLGWVYYKRNLPALAVEPIRRSITKDPMNPTYRYHLGLVYLKVGEVDKARAALREAVKLHPGFDKAKRALASIPS